MNGDGTTYYNSYSGGQWSQGPTGGFGGASNYPRANGTSQGFGSSGFKTNGSGGFGNSLPSQVFGQFPEPASNGFSNNNMNGFAPRPTSGFWVPPKNDSYKPQSDWNKQAAACDTQEKDLFDAVNSGINFDKYDDIPVQVSGSDPPTPIDTVPAVSTPLRGVYGWAPATRARKSKAPGICPAPPDCSPLGPSLAFGSCRTSFPLPTVPFSLLRKYCRIFCSGGKHKSK